MLPLRLNSAESSPNIAIDYGGRDEVRAIKELIRDRKGLLAPEDINENDRVNVGYFIANRSRFDH